MPALQFRAIGRFYRYNDWSGPVALVFCASAHDIG
jgi:hypothetical protein